MTARRVHLPPGSIEEGRARLGPAERHYLRDVLRLAPGAEVEVFDGRGGRYRGRLEEGHGAILLGPREEAPLPPVEIALLFALAKGEKVDLVVQKATELGAARILPFEAERSVVRLGSEKGEERAGRWGRIAAEAARQCGRSDVPEVSAPAPLAEVLGRLPPATRLLAFHPGGGALPPLEPGTAASLAAVVGPEGGLAPAEIEACERAGASAAGLGPRVLRAETAAIVAVALLQARYGDLS